MQFQRVRGIRELDRLSPEDERILALERGPVVGHICKVLILAGAPGDAPLTVERLRTGIVERLAAAPRCTQRILPLPRGLGRPVWVTDPRFEIRHHVRPAAGISAPLDDFGLQRLVARLMGDRLRRDRPLWCIDVAPLTASRTALIWRIHHCMADGLTALRLGGEFLWSAADPQIAATAGPPSRVPPPLDQRELLVAAALDRLRGARNATVAAVRIAATDPAGWTAAIRGARQVPGIVRRELLPSRAAAPLDAPVGRRRAVAWTSAPLTALHAAAKRVHPEVTLNDAVIALVAAGVREWLASQQCSLGTLRVRIPVSLHSPDDLNGDAGNRDSFIDVDAPMGAASIANRVMAVHAQTAERKRLRDAEHLDRLFRAIGALPFGSHALAMTAGAHEFALCVSNVPGPREPIAVLGHPVDRFYSVVEIAPHHDLRVSVLSLGGVMTFTICAEPESVDPEVVAHGIEAAIGELCSPHA